jgi:hypothetical protein
MNPAQFRSSRLFRQKQIPSSYSIGSITDVGSYSGDPSLYGTFDQGGNVWEWNDAVIGSKRGLRGGSWDSYDGNMASSNSFRYVPSSGLHNIGFRLASVPEPSSIPEPSSPLVLTALFGAGLVCRRKR